MKVGDYCYIKGISRDYGIGKITQLNSGYSSNGGELIDIQFRYSKHSVPKTNVVSSPKIIDLIEENDFVNHSRVVCIGISTDLKGTHKYLVLENGSYCPNGNIKSILTKEQFESMEYKVKE